MEHKFWTQQTTTKYTVYRNEHMKKLLSERNLILVILIHSLTYCEEEEAKTTDKLMRRFSRSPAEYESMLYHFVGKVSFYIENKHSSSILQVHG